MNNNYINELKKTYNKADMHNTTCQHSLSCTCISVFFCKCSLTILCHLCHAVREKNLSIITGLKKVHPLSLSASPCPMSNMPQGCLNSNTVITLCLGDSISEFQGCQAKVFWNNTCLPSLPLNPTPLCATCLTGAPF